MTLHGIFTITKNFKLTSRSKNLITLKTRSLKEKCIKALKTAALRKQKKRKVKKVFTKNDKKKWDYWEMKNISIFVLNNKCKNYSKKKIIGEKSQEENHIENSVKI